MGKRNVGSITTQLSFWLAEGLYTNRTLIWHSEEWGQADSCFEQTWECFFQPISNCT